MEKIKQLLKEQLDSGLGKIIISNPRKKNENIKVEIRPVCLSDKLCFQIARYTKTQVFHENLDKEACIAKIVDELSQNFKQFNLFSSTCEASALISKSATATLKIKRISAEGENGKKKELSRLSHNREKKYLLKEGVAVPFLVDLGVMTKEGKVISSHYDKFKQINRYLEFIEDILPALPKDRTVSIVDFGCGKSYLTFAMYYYLKVLKGYSIDVIGLDLKKEVIRNCNKLAEKYEYDHLTFLEGDIKDYNEKEEVDMIVTLHACDTATDYAIARAIAWNAKVILTVPCCQHEINKQIKCDELKPVLQYGLLKERISALLTDGIRASVMEAYGYETQVLEFIDMAHTPKNVLIRGVKKEKVRGKKVSMEEIHALMEKLNTNQTLVKLLEENIV